MAAAVHRRKNQSPEPIESAREAGLRYVSDERPGLRRIKSGKGFRYVDAEGKPIRDQQTLARIAALVIPPAWTEVWICPDPRGHLQATGRDVRGRKQHRYHPRWRAARDETKFDRMIAFGQALPRIRRATARHLKRPGLPREKVLAAVVCLLEKTLIRVGNDEYARHNNHFGLTTLRDRHVDVHGADVHFEFKGKSGVERTVDLHDRRLAKIIKHCQDLPGYELFQYLDEQGQRRDVTSADVNAYLQELTGQPFTAKDFRTWAGTMLAVAALRACEAADSPAAARKNVVGAVAAVARRLGNTQAVCRKCYIHPRVIEMYLAGDLNEALQQAADRPPGKGVTALSGEEAAIIGLLQSS
jgi:DNA topoisomerase-1